MKQVRKVLPSSFTDEIARSLHVECTRYIAALGISTIAYQPIALH